MGGVAAAQCHEPEFGCKMRSKPGEEGEMGKSVKRERMMSHLETIS